MSETTQLASTLLLTQMARHSLFDDYTSPSKKLNQNRRSKPRAVTQRARINRARRVGSIGVSVGECQTQTACSDHISAEGPSSVYFHLRVDWDCARIKTWQRESRVWFVRWESGSPLSRKCFLNPKWGDAQFRVGWALVVFNDLFFKKILRKISRFFVTSWTLQLDAGSACA